MYRLISTASCGMAITPYHRVNAQKCMDIWTFKHILLVHQVLTPDIHWTFKPNHMDIWDI